MSGRGNTQGRGRPREGGVEKGLGKGQQGGRCSASGSLQGSVAEMEKG